MDILPDEILLRIFAFLPFIKRITFRLVSWRWSRLLLDHLLLQQVIVNDTSCEDHQLEALMSAAKRVVEVDFFNCVNLTSSCLLGTKLSKLQNLTLTGTAINNGILLRILDSCKDELIELNLAGTCIRLCECLPKIVELKKLKYFLPLQGIYNCFGNKGCGGNSGEMPDSTNTGLPGRLFLSRRRRFTDCQRQSQAHRPSHPVLFHP